MTAWIRTRPADLAEAIGAGGRRIAAARLPVIAGLCADVDAIRVAYRLALTLGGCLDPLASPALYADLGALASAGAMTTTPSEFLGRADVVLAVGRAADSPLVAEFVAGQPSRGRAVGASRIFAAIGPTRPPDTSGTRNLHVAASGGTEVALTLSALRARVRRAVMPPLDAGLDDVAETLSGALFGVAVYDPGDIGELAVDMLQGLVKDLNRATRFTSLALADEWQGRAVLQVGAWTTADAPRVGFGGGFPDHDPWRYDAARMVREGEADAVLWLASLPAPAPGWGSVPTLAILGEATGREAEIVIAVAVPGQTAAGVVWDARRATLVHREAAEASARPTAAAVLEAIEAVVEAERARPC